MVNGANVKKTVLFAPTSATSAQTASGYIDTKGYDFAQLDVILGTAADTTAVATLTLKEGDTTSSYATFTGAVSGTDYTLAATSGTSGDSTPYATFNVDTRARKRYLQVLITPGTTVYAGCVGTLGRAEISPAATTTGMGSKVVCNV